MLSIYSHSTSYRPVEKKSDYESVGLTKMSSKTSPLQDSRLKVHKGEKGRLITAHDNPRLLKEDDPMLEFERCFGGREQAIEYIEYFKKINAGDKHQKAVADGIITSLIIVHKLSKRAIASVLKVGTGRIKRNRDGKSKQTNHVHLNGNQVHGTT
jgi:hypothetical protein